MLEAEPRMDHFWLSPLDNLLHERRFTSSAFCKNGMKTFVRMQHCRHRECLVRTDYPRQESVQQKRIDRKTDTSLTNSFGVTGRLHRGVCQDVSPIFDSIESEHDRKGDDEVLGRSSLYGAELRYAVPTWYFAICLLPLYYILVLN